LLRRGGTWSVKRYACQTLRDWVIRFNAQGPDGLINGKSTGAPPRLDQEQKVKLASALGPLCQGSREALLASVCRHRRWIGGSVIACHQPQRRPIRHHDIPMAANVNNLSLAQPRDVAADGFVGQPQTIGDIGSGQGQRELRKVKAVTACAGKTRRAQRRRQEETRNPFLGVT